MALNEEMQYFNFNENLLDLQTVYNQCLSDNIKGIKLLTFNA